MEKELSKNTGESENFILRVVLREWPVIKKAPASIGAIVLTCLAASYFAMNFFYSRQIATISEERDFTNRENEKLRSRVSFLESRVSEVNPNEWPSLTDQQITDWVKVLSTLHIDEIGVSWSSEVEALKFFRSLKKVGTLLNIPVVATQGLIGPVKQTSVAARDEAVAKTLADLFRIAGIPTKVKKLDATEGAYVEVIISEKP